MTKDEVIQLWLDAEEENRKHTAEGEEKCLQLKDQFNTEYEKLSEEDKQYVKDEMDALAC